MFNLINTFMKNFKFSYLDFDGYFLGNLTSQFVADVANFEGYREKLYKCPSGALTVGFGHTSYKFTPKTRVTVSLDTAKRILINDLLSCYKTLCSFNTKLSFTEFPIGLQLALTDFVFNCGIGTFLKSSMYTILTDWVRTSPSDRPLLLDRVCNHLLLYVYANKKKLLGLIRRREWEISLIKGC